MNDSVKINFIGDISLNDGYKTMYQNGVQPFLSVEPIMKNCNLVVGNLECLMQGSQGENTLKKPRLHTDINTINYLKDINLGLACLANNHVYDNLDDGFIITTSYLESNKIAYIGASIKKAESTPYIYTKGDIWIGILNYVTEDTNPKLPPYANVKLNFFEAERAVQHIKTLRNSVDHLVVFIHWGGTMEGSIYPHIDQPKLARIMVDAGADLIIGHHSHTLQPYEIYQGKHIFYSIGNFCFSDVIVDGKRLELDKKRTDPSIVLSVDFYKSIYSIEINRIINSNGIIKQCCSVKKNVRQISYNRSLLYKFPFWIVYFFYEKRIYPIIAYFFANGRNPIKQLFRLKWLSFIKHLKRLLSLN